MFQLGGNKEEGIQQVCSGPEACQWARYRNSDQVGNSGIYKTTKYTNGILHTYMSCEEDKLCQAQAKIIWVEAMERLMGSSAYQDQIWAVEKELGGGGEPGDEGTLFESLGGGDPEEWLDIEATYADIKANIKKEGSTGGCPV